MHTLVINVKDKAYPHIIYMLKKLSSDVEIVSDEFIESNFTEKESLKDTFETIVKKN